MSIPPLQRSRAMVHRRPHFLLLNPQHVIEVPLDFLSQSLDLRDLVIGCSMAIQYVVGLIF